MIGLVAFYVYVFYDAARLRRVWAKVNLHTFFIRGFERWSVGDLVGDNFWIGRGNDWMATGDVSRQFSNLPIM